MARRVHGYEFTDTQHGTRNLKLTAPDGEAVLFMPMDEVEGLYKLIDRERRSRAWTSPGERVQRFRHDPGDGTLHLMEASGVEIAWVNGGDLPALASVIPGIHENTTAAAVITGLRKEINERDRTIGELRKERDAAHDRHRRVETAPDGSQRYITVEGLVHELEAKVARAEGALEVYRLSSGDDLVRAAIESSIGTIERMATKTIEYVREGAGTVVDMQRAALTVALDDLRRSKEAGEEYKAGIEHAQETIDRLTERVHQLTEDVERRRETETMLHNEAARVRRENEERIESLHSDISKLRDDIARRAGIDVAARIKAGSALLRIGEDAWPNAEEAVAAIVVALESVRKERDGTMDQLADKVRLLDIWSPAIIIAREWYDDPRRVSSYGDSRRRQEREECDRWCLDAISSAVSKERPKPPSTEEPDKDATVSPESNSPQLKRTKRAFEEFRGPAPLKED